MRSFKDDNGTAWSIDLNVSTMRRVKALTEIDLTLPQSPAETHGTLANVLMVDFWKQIDVIFAICQPQIDAAGLTPEQFGELLVGGVLGEAVKILFEEWSDFFLKCGRADLAAAVKKTLAIVTAAAGEAVGQMDRLEAALMDKAKETMQATGDKALADAFERMKTGSGD